jgi:hypothetical protein
MASIIQNQTAAQRALFVRRYSSSQENPEENIENDMAKNAE